MFESATESSEKPSLWALAPGAMPRESLKRNPQLENLEDNAVFRVLIHQHRRLTRKRKGIVFGYLAAAVFGVAFYAFAFFGVEFARALSLGFAASVVLGLILGVLYIQAGIEGYETNGFLKPFFLDIIMTGLPAEDIARGIWGKTVANYPRRWLRAAAALVACMLFAIVVQLDRAHSPFLVLWAIYLGIWAAAHLFTLFGYLEYATLPGTLLWYTGVRRGYERWLAEIEGDEPSIIFAVVRGAFFIVISLSVLLIPAFIYFAIGVGVDSLDWPDEFPARFWMHAKVGAGFVITGIGTGELWGRFARANAGILFSRLVTELERLFSIRGHVLSSR